MSVTNLDQRRLDKLQEKLDECWKEKRSATKLQDEYDNTLRRYAEQVDEVEQKYLDYATAIKFTLEEDGYIYVEIDNGD